MNSNHTGYGTSYPVSGQANAYPPGHLGGHLGGPAVAAGLAAVQNRINRPVLEEIAGEVESIGARLQLLVQRLTNTCDRVLGQEPEGNGPISKPHEAYAGSLGAVQAQLAEARQLLDHAEYHATRLERL